MSDSMPETEPTRGDTVLAATAQPVPEEAPRLSEEEQAAADAEREGVAMIRLQNAQHFEIRTITEADWKKAGIEEGRTVHWHKGNKFMVPVEDLDFLTEEQFEVYIAGDGRFEIVTA